MPRKLRIAVSAFFGVLTLLLVVMWVRSYWRLDIVDHTAGVSNAGSSVVINSDNGYLVVLCVPFNHHRTVTTGWRFDSAPSKARQLPMLLTWSKQGFNLVLAYWALVVPAGFLTCLPWATYRFSLRTLLIATTLVAVVLGLTVWAA